MFMPVVQIRPVRVTVFQRGMRVFVAMVARIGDIIRMGMVMMWIGMAVQVGVDEGLMAVSMLVGFPEQQVD
jgi:hypothetical protein